MDIAGLGEALVDLFVDMKFIRSYADIYHLKERREDLNKDRPSGGEEYRQSSCRN